MLRSVTEIVVDGIPKNVNRVNIQRSIEYFLSCRGIQDQIVNIKYIGGCSNHALKVVVENNNRQQKSLMVRLPGSNAELLVNRHAERTNTAIVTELGVCPAFAKDFTERGSVLQLAGYKVEEFLEAAESLTHANFNLYRRQALAQLKKVHRCGRQFEGEYNILERIKLMCYMLQDVAGKNIASLDSILIHIERMEKQVKAFGPVRLVPCHNDIPPFNFMKMPDGNGGIAIKIIDWEFSAMNDPMVELAYLACENKYIGREAIGNLLDDYYADEVISMDEREKEIDKVLFYTPVIDLKVTVWSLLQEHMCNQSQYIEDLRAYWGPERYQHFLGKLKSPEYNEVITRLESTLAAQVSSNNLFRRK